MARNKHSGKSQVKKALPLAEDYQEHGLKYDPSQSAPKKTPKKGK